MPHQDAFDELYAGYTTYDPFAFKAYPDKSDGHYHNYRHGNNPYYGPYQADIPTSDLDLNDPDIKHHAGSDYGGRSRITVEYDSRDTRSGREDITFKALSSWHVGTAKNGIGFVYFNLKHLIDTYKSMSQEVITETDLGGNTQETIRYKDDFYLFDYIKRIWDDVNSACAGFYNFQISNELERPNIVRIIDKTVSGRSKPGELFYFNPQGLNTIVRDFYINSTISSDMASTISIAAQAPNDVSSLDQLSFRAFHKFITNRFSKIQEPTQSEIEEEIARRQEDLMREIEKYNNTMKDLQFFVDKLNAGNFEIQYDDDGDPVDRLITKETAKRYAKQLENQKNALLLKQPYWLDKEATVKNPDAGLPIHGKQLDRNAIIPLKFNMKMDGIGGITPLQIFKVNPEKLPEGYRDPRIAFIVNGESQKITAGQDWTIELSGQLMLEDDGTGAYSNGRNTFDQEEVVEPIDIVPNPLDDIDNDPEEMEISDEGLGFITDFEGFHVTPYWDIKQWSVGFGNGTWWVHEGGELVGKKVTEFWPTPEMVTEAKSLQQVRYHLEFRIYPHIKRDILSKVTLNQYQFDAVCSYAYNVGAGRVNASGTNGNPTNFYKQLIAGNFDAARIEMDIICGTIDGERIPLEGLINRRGKEQRLFMYDQLNATEKAAAYLGATHGGSCPNAPGCPERTNRTNCAY